MAFYRTFPFSAPQPQSLTSPSIEGRRFCFAPLTTLDRCGCRHKDCRLQFHSTFRDTSCLGSPVPLHLRQQTFRPELSTLNPDTHGCALGCRARSERRSFGNLHLLFRLVYDGLLLYKLQRARSPNLHPIPPTHRGVCRLHSTPSASLVYRLRRCVLPSVTHLSYALTGREVVADGQ